LHLGGVGEARPQRRCYGYLRGIQVEGGEVEVAVLAHHQAVPTGGNPRLVAGLSGQQGRSRSGLPGEEGLGVHQIGEVGRVGGPAAPEGTQRPAGGWPGGGTGRTQLQLVGAEGLQVVDGEAAVGDPEPDRVGGGGRVGELPDEGEGGICAEVLRIESPGEGEARGGAVGAAEVEGEQAVGGRAGERFRPGGTGLATVRAGGTELPLVAGARLQVGHRRTGAARGQLEAVGEAGQRGGAGWATRSGSCHPGWSGVGPPTPAQGEARSRGHGRPADLQAGGVQGQALGNDGGAAIRGYGIGGYGSGGQQDGHLFAA